MRSLGCGRRLRFGRREMEHALCIWWLRCTVLTTELEASNVGASGYIKNKGVLAELDAG